MRFPYTHSSTHQHEWTNSTSWLLTLLNSLLYLTRNMDTNMRERNVNSQDNKVMATQTKPTFKINSDLLILNLEANILKHVVPTKFRGQAVSELQAVIVLSSSLW